MKTKSLSKLGASRKIIKRNCVICGKKLEIIVNGNKTYKGGNYFGRIILSKSKIGSEYWECQKCFLDI